jgi:predicted nucleic acid-binding protein
VISGPVVIDASVVVEYLVTSRYTLHASRLFGRLLDPDASLELWAPDLIYAEVASAVRKLTARRLLDSRAGERAVGQLVRLPIAVAGTQPLVADAWKMSDHVTVYDACYVLLARRLRAPFVTADDRFARALHGRGGGAVLRLAAIS